MRVDATLDPALCGVNTQPPHSLAKMIHFGAGSLVGLSRFYQIFEPSQLRHGAQRVQDPASSQKPCLTSSKPIHISTMTHLMLCGA